MGKPDKVLIWVFTAVMLAFCFFMASWVLVRSDLDFQLADVELSLETSYGRERKQQYEYDQAAAELPLTEAELAETQPLADEASGTVTALKAERKALRQEKKDLEAALEAAQAGEGSHE